MLVNVASYARERMPRGGRLKIELAKAVVDRRFIANNPNVRPGSHVLVTVTEMASTARPDSSLGLALGQAGDATGAASDKPGVDFGPLLGLIGECGGHLWVTAEPPGNMVLKIDLPTRAASERNCARTGDAGRPRPIDGAVVPALRCARHRTDPADGSLQGVTKRNGGRESATDDTGRPPTHRAKRGGSPSRARRRVAWPRVSGTAHGFGSALSVLSVACFHEKRTTTKQAGSSQLRDLRDTVRDSESIAVTSPYRVSSPRGRPRQRCPCIRNRQLRGAAYRSGLSISLFASLSV